MTRLPDHLGVQRRPSEDRRIESVNFLTKLPGEATDRKGQFHLIESHRPSPFWINDSPLSAETDHPGWTGSKPNFRPIEAQRQASGTHEWWRTRWERGRGSGGHHRPIL